MVPGFPFLRTPFGNNSHRQPSLMFIAGYTIAIFQCQYRDTCYLFDSHSRDERGLAVQDGSSVVLKFENLFQLENYIQAVYLEYQSRERIYFQLQFISINMPNELKTNLSSPFLNFQRRQFYNASATVKNEKRYINSKYYEQHKNDLKQHYREHQDKYKQNYEKNKEMFQTKYQQEKENIKFKISQKYKIQKEEIKKGYQANKEKLQQHYDLNKAYIRSDRQNHVDMKYAENKHAKKLDGKVISFRKHIKEGPFYICVCCNRCLYRHSLKKFVANKYNFCFEQYCNIVASFDGLFYVFNLRQETVKEKNTLSICI